MKEEIKEKSFQSDETNEEIKIDIENDENNLENNKNNKKKSVFLQKVDKFFKISERGSSFKKEFLGGLVNFMVISYIMVVIPGLFSGVGAEGLWKALFVATILTTILATLCMALWANLPIILAPGIGVASFVVGLIESGQYSYSQAMSISFLAGVLFVIITITGLRQKIVNAIPSSIKLAIPIGVGLFILNVGLSSSNSGILDLLSGNATGFSAVVAVVSFIIMAVLYVKNVKGAIFYGILGGTLLDIIIKFCVGTNPFEVLWTNSFLPPFKEMFEYSFLQFDFAGLFTGNIFTAITSVILTVFAVVLMDLFDTVGTLLATAQKGNLLDEKGNVINQSRAMMIDGSGAVVSSCLGIPNASSYVESTSGIASGARTGLSGLWTCLFFALSLFISPIVMLIPVYATAPALILVGILMFDGVNKLDFKDLTVAIPAVLTIIIMPLSNNISIGIAVGLIAYTFIMIMTGQFKKINAFTYVITILFLVYFITQYI